MTTEQRDSTAKTYIGDSVYVEHGSFRGEIILTTDNGYPDDPRNRIGLEPMVLQSLFDWLRAEKILKESKT
jgi:hypothetical protein